MVASSCSARYLQTGGAMGRTTENKATGTRRVSMSFFYSALTHAGEPKLAISFEAVHVGSTSQSKLSNCSQAQRPRIIKGTAGALPEPIVHRFSTQATGAPGTAERQLTLASRVC